MVGKKVLAQRGLCLVLFVLVGCLNSGPKTSSGTNSNQTAQTSLIQSNLTTVFTDSVVQLKLQKAVVGNANWVVLREVDNSDLSASCRLTDPNDPSRLTCQRLPAGAVLIKIDGETLRLQVMDLGRTNAAPLIVCDLFDNGAGGNKIGRVSSDFTKEERRVPVVEARNFTFDCAPSIDEDLSSVLRYELVQNPDGPNPTIVRSATGSTRLVGLAGAAGSYPMAIRATDSQGRMTELRFDLMVSCSGPNDLQVASNPDSRLLVTAVGGPRRSFYRFDATGLVTSLRGNSLVYQWDFNGDGAMDSAVENNLLKNWTSAVVPEVYVAFATVGAARRDVKVIARDPICNFSVETTVPKSFPALRLLPGQSDQTGGDYLVQADIRPKNALASDPVFAKTTQADLQMWDKSSDPRRPYVNCTWNSGSANGNNASITINGVNNYYSLDPAIGNAGIQNDQLHGLSLTLAGLPHIPSNQSVSYTRTQAQSQLQSLSYWSVAGFENAPPRQNYNSLAQACTFQVSVETRPSLVPCNGQPGSPMTYALIVRGDFNCPNVQTSTSPTVGVEIRNGLFYCEARMNDSCPGGPGGGGGGDPIQGI